MQKPLRISKADSDGRRWTTKEQTTWLETQISAYINAQAGPPRSLPVFWAKLYLDWFARWPKEAAPSSLYPQADPAEEPATAKEDAEAVRIVKLVCTYCCSVAPKFILFWLQRLKQWFNNHARGAAKAAGLGRRLKPLDLSVRPTRKLGSTQAYMKLYWSKLKPIVDEGWEKHITEDPDASGRKGERLRHRNKLVSELFRAETEEVKQDVEQRREEGIASGDDTPEPEGHGDGESTNNTEKQRRAKAYALQR